MKSKHNFFWAVVLISIFTVSLSSQKQKTEWKGKIEYEDGVGVIKNPEEPLYGEIEFDLDEDLSIYTYALDEDEGMKYIKRYKIKNWDQIKEGIQS